MSFTTPTVDFAAVYSNSQATIVLLKMNRGADSLIRLLMTVPMPYGSDLKTWAHGGWTDGSYVSGVFGHQTDPWEECSYWGPLEASHVSTEKFCGQCGSPRAFGGRFCGGCGTPFKDASPEGIDLRVEVNSAGSSGNCSNLLLRLIDTHSLRDIDADTRKTLISKLPEVIHNLKLINFIDGQSIGSMSAEPKLTLAVAQRLAVRVGRGDQLDPDDLAAIGVLMAHAPIQFGYWGPFKSILKSLNPRLMPHEFGTALGRLTLAEAGVRGGGSDECEDLSVISSLFSLPSRKTLNYMRRRMRRQLAVLAETDPDTYAAVAASALIAADRRFLGNDFISAYIMFGARPYLAGNSRYVDSTVSQSETRYPHSGTWENHSNLARQVMDQVKHSTQVFTFAAQVLRSAGKDLPKLDERTVPLALESTDSLVVQEGYAHLAGTPGCWQVLSSNAWLKVYSDASLSDLEEITTGLLKSQRFYSVQFATADFLTRSDVVDLPRLAAAARVYLAYSAATEGGWRPGPTWTETDSAAVKALARAFGFDRTPEVWKAVLTSLDRNTLLSALIDLIGDTQVSDFSRALIEDVILLPATDRELTELACRCLNRMGPELDDLASRLLLSNTDQMNALTTTWNWLRTTNLPGERRATIATGLLPLADSEQANTFITGLISDQEWNLPTERLIEILSSTTAAPDLLWNALSAPESETVQALFLGNENLLLIVGEHVGSFDAARFTVAQQQLLVSYLTICTDRIARDIDFGVALACLPAPELQQIALEQLEMSGAIPSKWLSLAESSLPQPLAFARRHLESLNDRVAATDAVLAAIDSSVPIVRDMGLELLDSRRDSIDHSGLWAALLESDDAVVQARVAEEALVAPFSQLPGLQEFDRKIIVLRRGPRNAKENVKRRLDAFMSEDLGALIQPQRIEALLDASAGTNVRDREWALSRLALLSLAGVSVQGIDVSYTSGEAT